MDAAPLEVHIQLTESLPLPITHALRRSWFFSGSERMRLPVAAKIALQSAGATIAGGGSPQPPQKPPLGITMISTFGLSARRNIGKSWKFDCSTRPSLMVISP